jgi:anti-sigma B factor antagonist
MDVDADTAAHNGYVVVSVEGEVDVYTAPQLREQLIQLIDQGYHRVVVDLSQVEFLDSTGLGVLVGGLRRSRGRDGDLALVCTEPRIMKVFQVTGLTKVFTIAPSIEAAVATRSDG